MSTSTENNINNSSCKEAVHESLKDMNYLLFRLLKFNAQQTEKVEKDELSSKEYMEIANTLSNLWEKAAHMINNINSTLSKGMKVCSKANKENDFEPDLVDEDTQELPSQGVIEMNDCKNIIAEKNLKRKFNLSLKKLSDSFENSSSENVNSGSKGIEQEEEENNLENLSQEDRLSLNCDLGLEKSEENIKISNLNSSHQSSSCETEDLNLRIDSDSEEKFVPKIETLDVSLPNSFNNIPEVTMKEELLNQSDNCSTNKYDFFISLDLKPNLTETAEEIISDTESEESLSEKIEGSFQRLVNDNEDNVSSLNTSDSLDEDQNDMTTSESDSDEDRNDLYENEQFTVNPPQIPPEGRIINIPLTLPETDSEESSTSTERIVACDTALVKPCSVMLYRLEDSLFESTLCNDSDKRIFRKCNLKYLKRRRKRSLAESHSSTSLSDTDSDEEVEKRRRLHEKRRRKKTPLLESSDSEYVPTDNNSSAVSSCSTDEIIPVIKPFLGGGTSMLFADVIDLNSNSDNEDGDKSTTDSSSSSSSRAKKKKAPSTNINAETSKNGAEDSRMSDKNSDESDEENDNAKKKVDDSWKRDPLLTAPLTEPNQSQSGKGEKSKTKELLAAPTGPTDILPSLIVQKIEERHERRRKNALNGDDTTAAHPETSDSDETNIDTSSCIEDEDSSDIEFVSCNMTKKEDNSIVINTSDDEDTQSPSKTGRRNIREIMPESEETLLIRKKEEDRLKRLAELQQYRESFSQALPEEQLILDVNQVTEQPLVSVHPLLVSRMKHHQKEGVKFMWNVCFESIAHMQEDPEGSGCLLAHCMGLGKTFQIVSLVHTLFMHPDTNVKHVLIICPLSTVPNWMNEFKIALDHIDKIVSVFCINEKHRNKNEKLVEVEKWYKNSGVLLMGYEAFTSLVKTQTLDYINKEVLFKALCNPGPDLLVCDEGHNLKNGKTNRYKSLKLVNTKRKIILTGTPLQNNLKEYYHMVQFVKPNLLGSLPEFANRFANPIENGQFANSTDGDIKRMKRRSHVLHDTLVNTMQRFERSELEKYLKGKSDYVLFIKLHPIQVALYQKYVEMFVNPTAATPLQHFFNMQILWTHPRILKLMQEKVPVEKDAVIFEDLTGAGGVDIINLNDKWWKEICPEDYMTNLDYGPKFKVMLEILAECEKVGDKLLIFSSRLGELDAIEYFLQNVGTPMCRNWKLNQDYFRMDGNVPPLHRNDLCTKFNDKKNLQHRVFLVSRGVGGLGLNLVGANRVIIMDVNFNPSADSQSVMRIYRFGQEKTCFVYRLVAMGTMEEVIYERCVTKLAIAGRVVDEKQIERHFKEDEISKMFRCRVNFNEERPVPKLPVDKVLASILDKLSVEVYKYLEHQALLENLPEEELDEQERKEAWAEFKRERNNDQIEMARRVLSMSSMEQYNDAIKLKLRQPSEINNLYSVPSTSGMKTLRSALPSLTITTIASDCIDVEKTITANVVGNRNCTNAFKQSMATLNTALPLSDKNQNLNFQQSNQSYVQNTSNYSNTLFPNNSNVTIYPEIPLEVSNQTKEQPIASTSGSANSLATSRKSTIQQKSNTANTVAPPTTANYFTYLQRELVRTSTVTSSSNSSPNTVVSAYPRNAPVVTSQKQPLQQKAIPPIPANPPPLVPNPSLNRVFNSFNNSRNNVAAVNKHDGSSNLLLIKTVPSPSIRNNNALSNTQRPAKRIKLINNEQNSEQMQNDASNRKTTFHMHQKSNSATTSNEGAGTEDQNCIVIE